MKKNLCLVLALSIVLSLFTVLPVSAAATALYEGFEADTLNTSAYVASNGTMTLETDTTDASINKYTKNVRASSNWPTYRYTLKNSTQTLAAGDILEVEMDVKVAGFDTTNFQIRFNGTKDYPINFTTKGEIYRVANSKDSYKQKIGTMPEGWVHTNFNNWTRLKFVFEHCKYTVSQYNPADASTAATENNEYEGKILKAIYVNNEPVTITGSGNDANNNGCIWANMDANNIFGKDNDVIYKAFYFGQKMDVATKEVCVDNIHLVKHTSAETVPNYSAFVATIRSAQTDYEARKAELAGDVSYTTLLANYKSVIDTAVATYKNAGATQDDYTRMENALATARAAFDSGLESNVERDVWNFEGATSVPTMFTLDGTPGKGEVWALDSSNADATIGNYVKGTATAGYSNFYWDPGTYTTFDNEIMEIEFDFKAENFPADKDFQFRMRGEKGSDSKNQQFRVGIAADGKMYRATTDSSAKVYIPLIETFDRNLFKKWTRIKFVFENKKLTVNSTEYTGRKLIGIYFDNENIIDTSNAKFLSEDPTQNGCLWFGMDVNNNIINNNTDFNRIWFVGRSTSEAFCFDNMSVTQYTWGTEAPTDLSGFITSIRAAQADYQTKNAQYGSNASYAGALAEYSSSITDAMSVYHGTRFTQVDFNEAIAELKKYPELFGDAEILAVNYGSADELTANGAITGVKLKKTAGVGEEGTVLVGLYDKTTKELMGATLANNVFKDQNLGEVTVTFNNAINVPANISNLCVKAFLWDNLSAMSSIDILE